MKRDLSVAQASLELDSPASTSAGVMRVYIALCPVLVERGRQGQRYAGIKGVVLHQAKASDFTAVLGYVSRVDCEGRTVTQKTRPKEDILSAVRSYEDDCEGGLL